MEKENVRGKKYYILISCIVAILVAFDQITKELAILFLKGKEEVAIIKEVFVLQYLENQGAAFGMFEGKQWVFVISFLVLMVLALVFFYRVPMDKKFRLLRICILFIVAGAIGNSIDRFRHQYVVDFFYFKLINFPIFNMADIYVTVATIFIILLIMFYYKEADIERLLNSRKRK